ncbi:MAG: biopolymer transporter ExbD [Chthoniobacteraceae bacterium]
MKLQRTFMVQPALLAVVPMINVLFLVIVFFAFGSRFVLQPGLAVSLPVSSFTLAPLENPQIISITAAPVPAIYHRDRKVTLEELSARLPQAETQDRSLVIKADRATPFDLVAQVINVALRNGYTVVMATTPEAQ